MKKLFQNKFLLFSVLAAVLVFGIVAFVIISATATTKAVVLTQDTPAGTTITENMVQEIDVPKDTPGDYYKNIESVIGERLTSNIHKDQLLYPTNIMAAVEFVGAQNDDYVTASVILPDSQALGGLLTAGDIVDIGIVPNSGSAYQLAQVLPGFDIDDSVEGGFYYILSNVTILDATTSVSSSQGSSMSSAIEGVEGNNEESSYYMLSLSYNDYKKLRLADQYGLLYMNLSPSQNKDNAPLLKEMVGGVHGGLSNAADGTQLDGSTISYEFDKDGNLQVIITDKDGNKITESGAPVTTADTNDTTAGENNNNGDAQTAAAADQNEPQPNGEVDQQTGDSEQN